MQIPSYQISEDGRAITCLICGRTSHNRNDVLYLYCGHCHYFHENHPNLKQDNMQALLLDESMEKQILNLVTYAHANVIYETEFEEMRKGTKPFVSNRPNHTIYLPPFVACTFSVQESKHLGGLCLLLSVDYRGKLPSVDILKVLMEKFGFRRPLEKSIVQVNEHAPVPHVLVVEPINLPQEELHNTDGR